MRNTNMMDMMEGSRLMETQHSKVERIKTILTNVGEALEHKEKTKLGKIIIELDDMLTTIERTEPEQAKKMIKEKEEEIEKIDSQEAKRIKKETTKIIRYENEKAFLKSIIQGIHSERRDEAFNHILENFDKYITMLQKEYKDTKTAGKMREKKDEATKRSEKFYLESKEKEIEAWNNDIEIKECIKQLNELRKIVYTQFKDEKLYKKLMREGKKGDDANEITRLLFYEAERTYIERLIQGITNDDARWTFFLNEFYNKEVKNNKIVQRLRKFEDHWAVNEITQKKAIKQDKNAWTAALIRIQKRLEGDYKKKVITDAKEKLAQLLKSWIGKMAEDHAKMVNELVNAFQERLTAIENKKVPSELKKIRDDLKRDIKEQKEKITKAIQDRDILGLIKKVDDLKTQPRAESEIETIRKDSESIMTSMREEDKTFSYILNIITYMKAGNVNMESAKALKKAIGSLVMTSRHLDLQSERYNDTVEEAQETDKEIAKLSEEIISKYTEITEEIRIAEQKLGITAEQITIPGIR